MKIEKIKKIEGCLEGTNVKDVLLSGVITKDFIDYLALLGKLIYHEGSGKPFFKILVKAKYSIKGVLGGQSIRLVLPTKGSEEYLNEFEWFIEYFQD